MQVAPGAAWCRSRVVALIDHERNAHGNTALHDVEGNGAGVDLVGSVHHLETEYQGAGDRVIWCRRHIQEERKRNSPDIATARACSGHDHDCSGWAVEGGRGRLYSVTRCTSPSRLDRADLGDAVQGWREIGGEPCDAESCRSRLQVSQDELPSISVGDVDGKATALPTRRFKYNPHRLNRIRDLVAQRLVRLFPEDPYASGVGQRSPCGSDGRRSHGRSRRGAVGRQWRGGRVGRLCNPPTSAAVARLQEYEKDQCRRRGERGPAHAEVLPCPSRSDDSETEV